MASSATVAPQTDSPAFYAAERYKALRLLWRRTSLKSVRSCQHHSVLPDGKVKVLVTPTAAGPRVGFTGLATCGSVWSCPVCSHKISTRRGEDIAAAIRRWEEMGGRVAFVTLTMRHKRGQRLSDLWDALSSAWTSVTQWEGDQERFGTPMTRRVTHGARKGQVVTENKIGWLRAVEATHGVNGWHLHVHALMFLRGDVDLDGLSKAMFQRWRARLVGLGLHAPIASKGGLDARWVAVGDTAPMADYFTKSTLDGALRAGFEASRGGHKKAGGTTPFGMLANVTEHHPEVGNADSTDVDHMVAKADLARWWEWEAASKGRRQITWSRGFRDFLALDVEETDDEIAAEDATTDDTVTHAHYVNSDWALLRRDIAEVKRQAAEWYEFEYLPTLEAFPPWLEQWRQSWWDERLARAVGLNGN